jgi:Methylase involved in ubiquinone/menaquinone biosynthesis
MKNYVDVAYDVNYKPMSTYPEKYAMFLMKKFKLKAGMVMLDNGCGRGEYIDAFSKLGIVVCGADICNSKENITVLNMNIDKLPYADNTFDVVFSKSVIEHIEKTEFYMDEMKRVLKPGGQLIISTPDWDTHKDVFYHDPTHIHPYTVNSMRQLLNMEGYEHVTVVHVTQLPSVWDNTILGKTVCFIGRYFTPNTKDMGKKWRYFSKHLIVLGGGIKL